MLMRKKLQFNGKIGSFWHGMFAENRPIMMMLFYFNRCDFFITGEENMTERATTIRRTIANPLDGIREFDREFVTLAP